MGRLRTGQWRRIPSNWFFCTRISRDVLKIGDFLIQIGDQRGRNLGSSTMMLLFDAGKHTIAISGYVGSGRWSGLGATMVEVGRTKKSTAPLTTDRVRWLPASLTSARKRPLPDSKTEKNRSPRSCRGGVFGVTRNFCRKVAHLKWDQPRVWVLSNTYIL